MLCSGQRGRGDVEEVDEYGTHVEVAWVASAAEPVEDGADKVRRGPGHRDGEGFAGKRPGDDRCGALTERVAGPEKFSDRLAEQRPGRPIA